jgi:hypothetical protein
LILLGGTTLDEMMHARKQYICAKGLCDKCAENGPMDISVHQQFNYMHSRSSGICCRMRRSILVLFVLLMLLMSLVNSIVFCQKLLYDGGGFTQIHEVARYHIGSTDCDISRL